MFEPTAYEPHNKIGFEEKINFAGHEQGRVGVFKIKMISLVQKQLPFKKCQFYNI